MNTELGHSWVGNWPKEAQSNSWTLFLNTYTYKTFCCVVSLSISTSCAVFWWPRTESKYKQWVKNSQWYYTTRGLIRDLLSNTPNCYVCVGTFRGYLFMGNAWLKYEKWNRIGTEIPANWLVNSKQTCLTSPLKYKYCVIFVLVLGVICTLRNAVG